MDEKAPNAIAVIDHFLETILRTKVAFPYRLDMHIGKNQKITEDTLLKKGFFKSDKSFVKIIINKFPDKKNWEALAKSVRSFSGISLPERFPKTSEIRNTGILLTDSEGRKKTLTLFELETIISPRFILTDDRDCVLVPIKSIFADSLITNTRNQLSLLHSHEKSLLLEKAYFRSTSKSSIFKKGGIVCFYVSGSKSIQQLVGLARITFSEKISIDKAKIRLDRQGVISHHDLLEISDKNEMVHVFTFDNFLELDNRIDFSKAKELNLISNANLVAPEKINFDKLRTLIEHAFYD